MKKRVVVIGGGLAGMAAAVALEQSGSADVTLLEARRTLGGRAGSFEEPITGEELDNCQHVLLGCCTSLLDFYHRIGATDKIRWERQINIAGHRLYGMNAMPAPLHLGAAMAGFGLLTLKERASAVRAMLAMMRLGRSGREKLEATPFGQWLDEHKQSPELIRKLYDVVLIGALNEDTRNASAKYALQVFQESLLANRTGYLMGVPGGTLSDLYRDLPVKDVRSGTRADQIMLDDDRIIGVKVGGETITTDAVVLAVNHHTVGKFVPTDRDPRFSGLGKLQSVPILGVHLWFDRPVLKETHMALVSGPLQWIFRKDPTGLAVHGVISAARNFVDRDKNQMLKEFESQVRDMLPSAKEAKLERGVVVIEKRATFSPAPGTDQWRPVQKEVAGGLKGLFLAGDWTKTGWPATMEGAVRSGYLAAEAVLDHKTRLVADDLPVEWPGRMLGLNR